MRGYLFLSVRGNSHFAVTPHASIAADGGVMKASRTLSDSPCKPIVRASKMKLITSQTKVSKNKIDRNSFCKEGKFLTVGFLSVRFVHCGMIL